jgi:hypothetical protein
VIVDSGGGEGGGDERWSDGDLEGAEGLGDASDLVPRDLILIKSLAYPV